MKTSHIFREDILHITIPHALTQTKYTIWKIQNERKGLNSKTQIHLFRRYH